MRVKGSNLMNGLRNLCNFFSYMVIIDITDIYFISLISRNWRYESLNTTNISVNAYFILY